MVHRSLICQKNPTLAPNETLGTGQDHPVEPPGSGWPTHPVVPRLPQWVGSRRNLRSDRGIFFRTSDPHSFLKSAASALMCFFCFERRPEPDTPPAGDVLLRVPHRRPPPLPLGVGFLRHDDRRLPGPPPTAFFLRLPQTPAFTDPITTSLMGNGDPPPVRPPQLLVSCHPPTGSHQGLFPNRSHQEVSLRLPHEKF